MSELTIVIPALDDRGHLQDIVCALEPQQRYIREIVISHSGSGNPMLTLSGGDIPVRYVHSRLPLSSGAARNRGVAVAGGNWLAFLDDDVIPASDWAVSVHELLASSAGDTCYVGAIAVDEAGGYWGMCLWYLEFGSVHPYLPARSQEGGASANMFVDRALFDRSGGFPDQVARSVDIEFMARCRAAGGTTRFEPAAVVGHRNIAGRIHCLRHAESLGDGSARVRMLTDIRAGFFARHPLCAPLLIPLRLGLILYRLIRWGRGYRLDVLRHLPGLILAVIAWTRGFYRSASRRDSVGNSLV